MNTPTAGNVFLLLRTTWSLPASPSSARRDQTVIVGIVPNKNMDAKAHADEFLRSMDASSVQNRKAAGDAMQAALDQRLESAVGVVRWYHVNRGFGFLHTHKEGDFYFHISRVLSPELKVGDKVNFMFERSDKARNAFMVRVTPKWTARSRSSTTKVSEVHRRSPARLDRRSPDRSARGRSPERRRSHERRRSPDRVDRGRSPGRRSPDRSARDRFPERRRSPERSRSPDRGRSPDRDDTSMAEVLRHLLLHLQKR